MAGSNNNVIQLKHPIKVPGKDGQPESQITTLRLQRLKAKHLRMLPRELFISTDKMGDEVSPAEKAKIENEKKMSLISKLPTIIASLTGISQEAADEIDLEDLMGASDVLVNFLSASLGSVPDGKTS